MPPNAAAPPAQAAPAALAAAPKQPAAGADAAPAPAATAPSAPEKLGSRGAAIDIESAVDPDVAEASRPQNMVQFIDDFALTGACPVLRSATRMPLRPPPPPPARMC